MAHTNVHNMGLTPHEQGMQDRRLFEEADRRHTEEEMGRLALPPLDEKAVRTVVLPDPEAVLNSINEDLLQK